MINPEKIQEEKKAFDIILNDYSNNILSLDSSWKGISHKNLKSEASDFVENAKAISSYFSAYSSAASLYQKYKEQKQIHREYKSKYQDASELNPQRIYFNKRKKDAFEKMQQLKKEINTQLKKISGVKCSNIGNPTEITLKLNDTRFIEIALAELGMTDADSGKYLNIVGTSFGNPWCAAFVSWVANEIGMPESEIIPTAFAPTMKDHFVNNGKFEKRGDYSPKRGDIIFFDRDYNGIPNHVGIVESNKNGEIHTIEGNSSDQVKQNIYDVNNSTILGYGTPDYSKCQK